MRQLLVLVPPPWLWAVSPPRVQEPEEMSPAAEASVPGRQGCLLERFGACDTAAERLRNSSDIEPMAEGHGFLAAWRDGVGGSGLDVYDEAIKGSDQPAACKND